MTASTAETPPEETSRRSRSVQPSEDGAAPEPPKLRRRPMLIAVSVLLTAVGALLGAWLLTGLSGTESYIGVRKDIERGQVIKETDLVRTQLSTDAAVTPLLWDEQRGVVGQYAKTDMAAGSVVTRDSIERQSVPPKGYTTVGTALVPGQAPAGELKTGDPIQVIIVPPNAGEGATAPDAKNGFVVMQDMASDGTTKLVDVAVPDASASAIAASAARQEVAVIRRSTDTADPAGGAAEPTDGTTPGN